MAMTNVGTALLTAVSGTGAGKALAMDGPTGGAVCVQLDGITTATVTWQATVDGRNWHSVEAELLATAATETTATADGIYRIEATGLAEIRPNVTAYTSGSIYATAFGQFG